MGAIRNLVVKLTGDTSGLQKSLGDAQSKVKSTVGGIQKSTGALASIGAALGPIGIAIGAVTAGLAAFGGVAGTAISAVADGVSGAVGTLTDLAQETMPLYKEAAEAEAKLVTVMRQRMGATNEMISSALELAAAEQRTGAVEGDAIIAGQQQLSTFLHNADALKILTPAMADLAAQQKGVNATSGDLTTIANLMGKAMDGSAGALKKTGISFSEAQAKILKTGTEMQRAAMLAQIITDNVGDMNQALASTGIGKIQQMTNAWGDVKEQVGQVFTNLVAAAAPAIMTVINFLSTALSYATAFSNAFAGITGMFGGVSATAEDAASGAGSAADSIDGMGDSVKKAGAAAKKSLASFDQLNILSKGGGGGGVSGGGDDDKNNGGGENGASAAESWVQKFLGNFDFTPLKTAINGLLQALKPLADDAWSGLKWAYNNILVPLGKWTIEKALPASIDVLTAALKALDPIIDALKPLGEWLWNNFLKPIGQWAGERVITLLRNMASAFTAIGNWAKDHREIIQKIGVAFGTLATVFGAIVGTGIVWVIQSLVGPVAAVAAIVGVLTAAFVAVSVAIQTVAQWIKNTLIPAFQNGWSNIKATWGNAGSWFAGIWNSIKGAFSAVGSWFGSIFNTAWTNIKSAFASVGSFFGGVWETIKSKFTSVGTSIGNAVGGTFKTAVNSIFATIERIINNFIKQINSILSVLNKISGGRIGTIPLITLPRLAKGGWATSPMASVIGDNPGGKGEVALPLSGDTSWAKIVAGELLNGLRPALAGVGAGGGDTLVYIDSTQTAARVVKKNAWSGTKGASW